MRLSDLQRKDVININDGRKIGVIIDANVSQDGKITCLVIDGGGFFSKFSNHGELEIEWSQVKKIGEDVILVSIDKL